MTPENAQNILAKEGNCGGEEELFFSNSRKDWNDAKQICRRCPVQDICLMYALETQQVHGVWGGADPRQLREALGLDAAGDSYTWSIVRCPSCRTAQVPTNRVVREDKPQKRGWVAADRTCHECHLEWTRLELRKIPRTRKK